MKEYLNTSRSSAVVAKESTYRFRVQNYQPTGRLMQVTGWYKRQTLLTTDDELTFAQRVGRFGTSRCIVGLPKYHHTILFYAEHLQQYLLRYFQSQIFSLQYTSASVGHFYLLHFDYTNMHALPFFNYYNSTYIPQSKNTFQYEGTKCVYFFIYMSCSQ